MKKYTLLFWTLFAFQCLWANTTPIISVACDRYKLTVKSNFKYTTKVSVRLGNRTLIQQSILGSGGETYRCGTYSAEKVKRMSIVCSYDNSTYIIDTVANYKVYQQKMSNINAALSSDLNDSYTKLLTTMSAQAAVSLSEEITGDDFFSQIFRGGLRLTGEATKGAVDIYEGTKTFLKNASTLENKTYKDDLSGYVEFLGDLKKMIRNEPELASHVEDLDKLLDIVKENTLKDWSPKTKEYLKKRIVVFAQDITEDFGKYIEREKNAFTQYSTIKTDLKQILNDKSFTLNHTYEVGKITYISRAAFQNSSPEFGFFVEPLVYGGKLNQYWDSPKDPLIVDDGDDTKWGNGMFNYNVGAGLFIAVSPEMVLKRNGCYPAIVSRFYLEGSYRQTAHRLIAAEGYSLSNNFFSATGTGGFTVSKPIEFQRRQYAVGLDYRIIFDDYIVVDLTGGIMQQSGVLNLSKSDLDPQPPYAWAAEKIPVTDDIRTPYYGFRIGMNYRRSQIYLGTQVFEPKLKNTTNYRIQAQDGTPIDFDGARLNYLIQIGWLINLKL